MKMAMCYANFYTQSATQTPGLMIKWYGTVHDIVQGSGVPMFSVDDNVLNLAQLTVVANVCGFVDVADPGLDGEVLDELSAGMEAVYKDVASETKEIITEANATLQKYITDPRYTANWRFVVSELLLLHFSGATETAMRAYNEIRTEADGKYASYIKGYETDTREASDNFRRMNNKCRIKQAREEVERDNEELKRLKEMVEQAEKKVKQAEKKVKHSNEIAQKAMEEDIILAAGPDRIPVRLLCNKGVRTGTPMYGFVVPSNPPSITTEDEFEGEMTLSLFTKTYHTSNNWKTQIQVLPNGELLHEDDRMPKSFK